MKRFIISVITLALIAYALVIASTQNLLGINRNPSFKAKISYGRKLTGIGALFTREGTLVNYQTCYQFYNNGKWEDWHLMEHETFDKYLIHGNLSALKHTHLDTHLGKDLYFNAYLKKKPLATSAAYKVLISHLILGHYHNQTPDSIRLVYQKKTLGQENSIKLTNLLTFSAAL